MSYEFRFVPRLPGGSVEEALAAAGSDLPAALPPERVAQFTRLVEETRAALSPGDVLEESASDTARTLRHEPSGVHLTVLAEEVTLEGPEDDADLTDDVLAGLHQLAAAVERVTGLVGWDLVLGEAVSDPTIGALDDVRPGRVPERNDDGEEARSAPRPVPSTAEPLAPPRRRAHPWWAFWR